ncbi:2-oxoglutarate dehydrogenase [Vibrio intestinalis]|uniref:2-oxoglutarate dehydrogenase n=1 Tax=Vibrio intestinalis TaxID=2933291 RepID=UPI0021A295AB|nr:2-oxoglutarate dehydrogenase [Vibrio intestinalis]
MKMMIIAISMALAVAGCAQSDMPKQSTSPICQSKAMPGGWQTVEVTPEVRQAVETLMLRIEADSELKQINQVRSQVVNGTNYAIEIELINGEVWHGIVHRNLRNDYMIDSVAKQGPLCH